MSSLLSKTPNIQQNLKTYIPRNQEKQHRNNVINEYKKRNIEIIFSKVKVDHDGYDYYGPQSDLYDFHIFYREGHNYYIDTWHREDWYCGADNEKYELSSHNNQYKKIKESLLYSK